MTCSCPCVSPRGVLWALSGCFSPALGSSSRACADQSVGGALLGAAWAAAPQVPACELQLPWPPWSPAPSPHSVRPLGSAWGPHLCTMVWTLCRLQAGVTSSVSQGSCPALPGPQIRANLNFSCFRRGSKSSSHYFLWRVFGRGDSPVFWDFSL